MLLHVVYVKAKLNQLGKAIPRRLFGLGTSVHEHQDMLNWYSAGPGTESAAGTAGAAPILASDKKLIRSAVLLKSDIQRWQDGVAWHGRLPRKDCELSSILGLSTG